MDTQEQSEYRAHVRGAATYILLGQKNPPISTLEVAETYKLDLATVTADVDAVVQSERVKVGGVFEAKAKEITE
jgi:hypothetical protein